LLIFAFSDFRIEVCAKYSCYSGITPRTPSSINGAGGYFATGNIEDRLTPAGNARFGVILGSTGRWRGWDGEEGTFVRFGVSDQSCDIVRREESIAENAWGWEAVVG